MAKTNCRDGYVAYNFDPPIQWVPVKEFWERANNPERQDRILLSGYGMYYTNQNGKLYRVIIVK